MVAFMAYASVTAVPDGGWWVLGGSSGDDDMDGVHQCFITSLSSPATTPPLRCDQATGTYTHHSRYHTRAQLVVVVFDTQVNHDQHTTHHHSV